MTISESSRRYFEEVGETVVRNNLERGVIYPHSAAEANEWLEEVQLRRMEISNAPSLRIAKSAKDAAVTAAIAAIIAIPIAIIAIIISVLAWLYPHAAK